MLLGITITDLQVKLLFKNLQETISRVFASQKVDDENLILFEDTLIQADIDKFLAEQKKGVSKERKSLQVNTDDDFGASKSRIARNLAVGPLSIAAGMMATAQQAQATIRNPSQENLYNLGFDAANTLTDAVGLFPPAAGISEGVQRGLSFAQMGYNATRSLKIKPPK